MKNVKNTLYQVFTGNLNDKTLASIEEIFQFWEKEDVLEDFFTKKKWKECGKVGSLLRKMWEGNVENVPAGQQLLLQQ